MKNKPNNAGTERLFGILCLFKMQLQEKLKFDLTNKNKVAGFFAIKAVWFVSTALVTYFVLFFFYNYLRISGTQELLAFLMLVFVASMLIAAVVGLTKSLYASSDNQLLFSFPVYNSDVFLSKILVYVTLELISSATLLLPMLLGFAVFSKAAAGFYFMLIPAAVLIPLLVAALAALMSIPMHMLSFRVKRSKILSLVFLFLGLGLATFLYTLLISNIGEEIDLLGKLGAIISQIRTFINGVAHGTYIFMAFTDILYFNSFFWLKLLIFISIAAVLFVLSVVAVRPFFFRMAAQETEHADTRKIKPRLGKATGGFWSSVRKEVLLLSRDPGTVVSAVLSVVAAPLVVYALNALLGALQLRELGRILVLCGNILIILVMLLSSNSNSATGITKEGKAFYLTKSMPLSYNVLGYAKIAIDFVLSFLSMVIIALVLSLTTKIGAVNSVLIAVFCFMINLSQVFIVFENDLKNPIMDWYDEAEGVRNSKNAERSQIYGYLFAFVIGIIVACLFFTSGSFAAAWVKIFVMSVAILIFRLVVFNKRVRYYYQDIEL